MGGKDRKPKRSVTAETQQFISEIGQNQEISELTRKELSNKAQTALHTATSEEQFNALAGAVRQEFEQAKSGSSSKFKFRQFQEKRLAAIKDRPGRRQTILGR